MKDIFLKYPKATVSRQKSIVRDGNTLSSGSKVAEWRFFVEYPNGTKGVENFVVKMSLLDASKALASMGVKRAVHLDGGPESHGKFYDKEGNNFNLGDENYSARNYSTALILH